MAKVVDRYLTRGDGPLIICDFSPPRGGLPDFLKDAKHIGADFLSVAYSPGMSVRVNSMVAAYAIRIKFDKEVIFTLATRDMNKMAIQSLLLGAQLLDLENVVVVMGDPFTDRLHRKVGDCFPTDLIESITGMNRRIDFKGKSLHHPTEFCIGATVDLGRDFEAELNLTRRKVNAGAHFFMSQPVFCPSAPLRLTHAYLDRFGSNLTQPIFHGIQVMARESLSFGKVPAWVMEDLKKGRTGVDIALETIQKFDEKGLHTIYLVPPILASGRRDYESVQEVIESYK